MTGTLFTPDMRVAVDHAKTASMGSWNFCNSPPSTPGQDVLANIAQRADARSLGGDTKAFDDILATSKCQNELLRAEVAEQQKTITRLRARVTELDKRGELGNGLHGIDDASHRHGSADTEVNIWPHGTPSCQGFGAPDPVPAVANAEAAPAKPPLPGRALSAGRAQRIGVFVP